LRRSIPKRPQRPVWRLSLKRGSLPGLSAGYPGERGLDENSKGLSMGQGGVALTFFESVI